MQIGQLSDTTQTQKWDFWDLKMYKWKGDELQTWSAELFDMAASTFSEKMSFNLDKIYNGVETSSLCVKSGNKNPISRLQIKGHNNLMAI